MLSMDIFIEKLKQALDIQGREDITQDTRLEVIEWDSLATLSVLVLIQEAFGKIVDSKRIRQCVFIRDIYRLGADIR